MSQDNLGLFDTPASGKQIRVSIGLITVLVVILVATLTTPDVKILQINSFIPVIDASTCLVDLIIATLFYVQASVFRSRALTALATGYVFTGLILIPHALTFPGAFAPNGMLGAGTSSTAWIYIFWRMGLPTSLLLYMRFNRADASVAVGSEQVPPRIVASVCVALAMVVLAAALATAGKDFLPALYFDRSTANYSNMIWASLGVLALAAVAIFILFKQRKSVLDTWLLVVMAAWLVQTLLFLALRGRFTVSWYFAVVVVLVSHFFLMLALIAESSLLYARLALSTAVRNREREARLMSMDGVTAAISHEVAQPLTAVTLNAAVGLEWLTRDRPDPEKAIKALRDTLDAGRRTFDVIKSIRAMFAKVPGAETEFSVNDLVRETAELRQTELRSANILLDLDLDETLHRIFADRVQIQRVLINILTNAIESLAATRRRRRRIAINSTSPDSDTVILEISDNGLGIDPSELDHIFDAFFTTKTTGTGLGLSLCRTIVEEHGGRLWVTAGQKYGAVFHLQLPRRKI